uniref:Uncharacterized protein n=1 Tax=Alloyangia mangrovi TaxID=1779329 RepID=A0A2A3JRQ6_9RHOB
MASGASFVTEVAVLAGVTSAGFTGVRRRELLPRDEVDWLRVVVLRGVGLSMSGLLPSRIELPHPYHRTGTSGTLHPLLTVNLSQVALQCGIAPPKGLPPLPRRRDRRGESVAEFSPSS